MQVAVRGYVDSKQKYGSNNYNNKEFNRVLVFDTETTTDVYQNLMFGAFSVYQDNVLEYRGIFYNSEILVKKQINLIKKFCKKNNLNLYSRKEFVENIFYPEIYDAETLCIGFNLPFDISRLAIDYGKTRYNMKNGFSFKLSKNKKYPRIKIKHIDKTKSFIQFARGLKYNGEKSSFKGNFLDIKTLAFALTNDSHTLESACKLFDTEHKKTKVDHGKITEKYLEYNLQDVKATYDLFLKLKHEYKKYDVNLPITKVYSPASIGKACLDKFGIRPFLEKNPDFPKKILGYLMTTYYGGRCEVKIRKQPTKITVIDFTSMYPTVCILQNLWKYVISKQIKYFEDTENVRKFIDNITLSKLRKKSTWKKLNAIIEIEPNEDILPIRTKYDKNKDTFNIGINYVSSKKTMWYSLADIIASKLLTGKTPKIRKAIRFELLDYQDNLNNVNILDIDINPKKQDFFKELIEKRKEVQYQMKAHKTDSIRYKQLESKQKALKIIANASSYGIFVEINTEDTDKSVITKIYGLNNFNCQLSKLEKFGKAFNPILAVLITSASRLILAITETLLKKHNETYAFCDTDSMAIPDKYVKEIQNFFEALNPYEFKDLLFKVEYKDVWFYGISSKRYVLYKKKGKKIEIIKHSLHGLGHLENPFPSKKDWQKQIWLDILKEHYGFISNEQFNQKYSGMYAISQLTASTPIILDRFAKLNKRKDYTKKIKPFNFVSIGFGNKDNVKPIAPFSKNSQKIVYEDFVDYNTKKVLRGLEYWKSLDIILDDYKNHKESKFDGKTGILKRKHVIVDSIIHIGKETNNLENTGILDAPSYTIYQNNKELAKKILKLKPKDVKKYGIRRNTLWYIKQKIKSGKPVKFSNKIYDTLLKMR